MRLLLITQDYPPEIGGIQTYSHQLAMQMAPRCESFAVVAPDPPGAIMVDVELPFPIHRLPVMSDEMGFVTVPALPWLALRGRVDALLHSQWTTVAAGLTAKRLGIVKKVFMAAHGRELLINHLGEGTTGGRGFDALRRKVVRGVDGFFPVSNFTGGLLEDMGVEKERIHVVNNGVDPETYHEVDGGRWRRRHGFGDEPILMTLARLVERKGIDTVIRSLSRVAEAVPQVKYVVVGAGPDLERLEALARNEGIEERVTFVGRVPAEGVNMCLSACDVFVMPARSDPPEIEGFGLVFLEAGACGRAVVGARAGGVPDAILHGETGLLVEPNDVDGLAEALITLLTDDAMREKMGRTGRERVETTGNWATSAERILEVIERGVGG